MLRTVGARCNDHGRPSGVGVGVRITCERRRTDGRADGGGVRLGFFLSRFSARLRPSPPRTHRVQYIIQPSTTSCRLPRRLRRPAVATKPPRVITQRYTDTLRGNGREGEPSAATTVRIACNRPTPNGAFREVMVFVRAARTRRHQLCAVVFLTRPRRGTDERHVDEPKPARDLWR